MSNAPYLMHGARDGLRFGHASLQDSMIQTACGTPLTTTTWAYRREPRRRLRHQPRARDAFAASSQRKAAAAIAAGRFREEIVPVSVPQGKKAAAIRD